MDNKLSELSKPVAWPNGCNETAVEALRYLAEKPRPSYGNSPFNAEHLYMIASEIKRMADQSLYSQEYVSALLSKAEADMEIKARLCRESNSLHDRLKAAEKRIAELEAKLATPVRLPDPDENDYGYQSISYLQAIDAINDAGFTVEGDE